MRASRLLSILIALQLRGRMTADELAREFETSKRTIYRDIDALSAAGVPVYADRGPGGGFQLLDGYRTRLTGVSEAEAGALMLMGLSEPAGELGLGDMLVSGRLKVLASLPPAAAEGALKVADRLHLDPVDWHRRLTPPASLAAVAEAVWGERRIEVEYESWDKVSRRRLEPLGLVLKAGGWYALARSRTRIGVYRLDKMRGAIVLDERFERPASFDLAAAWREHVRDFEASLRRGTAVLRASSAALSRLDRLGADMAEPLKAAAPDADGFRTAEVPIESVRHAAGLLLGLADAVEALAPEALRREIGERARQAADLYGNPCGATDRA